MKQKHWIAIVGMVALLGTGCEKVSKAFKKMSEKKAETSTVAVASGRAEIRHINGSADFDAFVKKDGRVAVIDFYADWCGPCKVLGPTLEKVAGEFGSQVGLGKVNVDKNSDVAAKWRIRAIPDVRIFRDGKQVDAFVGNIPEAQVRERLQRQVSRLKPPETQSGDSASPASKKKEPSITRMKKDWVPPGLERQ
jgi:thioredoxin